LLASTTCVPAVFAPTRLHSSVPVFGPIYQGQNRFRVHRRRSASPDDGAETALHPSLQAPPLFGSHYDENPRRTGGWNKTQGFSPSNDMPPLNAHGCR
jgi:hypothetical protein